MVRIRGKTLRYGQTTPLPPGDLLLRWIRTSTRSWTWARSALYPYALGAIAAVGGGYGSRPGEERPSLLLQFVVSRSRRVHCCQIRFRRPFVFPRILSRIRCLLWIPSSSVVFSRAFQGTSRLPPRYRRGSFTPSDPPLQRWLLYPSPPWTAGVSEYGRRCSYVRPNLTLECLIARAHEPVAGSSART